MSDCAICLDTIIKPFTLPCSHIFCTGCIESAYKSKLDPVRNDSIVKLSCPLCRNVAIQTEGLPLHWIYNFNTAPDVETLNAINKYYSFPYGKRKKKKKLSDLHQDSATVVRAIEKALMMGRKDMFKWWFDRIDVDIIRHAKLLCHVAFECGEIALFATKLILRNPKTRIEIMQHILDYQFTYGCLLSKKVSLEIYTFWYEKSVVVWSPLHLAKTISAIKEVHKLDWVFENLPLHHFQNVFYQKDIAILDWWYRHAYSSMMRLDIEAIIDEASSKAVLQWWKTTLDREGIEFKYTEEAISNAVLCDDLDRLVWWEKSGCKLKISVHDIRKSIRSLGVVQWLLKHASEEVLHFMIPQIIRTCVSTMPFIRNLRSSEKFKIMNCCVDYIKAEKRHAVFRHSANVCITFFCRHGSVKLLDWWEECGMPIKYNKQAMDEASRGGHLNVLKWFADRNLPYRYSKQALSYAFQNGHQNVVRWWQKQNVPLRFDIKFMTRLDTTVMSDHFLVKSEYDSEEFYYGYHSDDDINSDSDIYIQGEDIEDIEDIEVEAYISDNDTESCTDMRSETEIMLDSIVLVA